MKKRNALMISLAVVALMIVGCNNDDSNCIPDLTGELSSEETSFSHTWVLAEIVSDKEIDLTDDNDDNPSTDLFSQYSACERDAVYEFKNDRNYAFKQGQLPSGCNNKQTSVGTWKLEGNTLTLVSFCNMRIIDIEINTEKTSFFIEDNFNFTDAKGTVVNSNVKFTYNKVTN
ncbi:DUF5004 domain-containing protein [Flavivirga algicola]|uniref:DUF5004 domain-containing protein n=1 Tax=Flavivirga algicola TaxID=2729136 RepID=A0ABX1RUC7_9FLAO|nr:DUF5004 domain-containing protein [Flavivirga algicola]NMH87146.1 DUF5004 domain-containing protein [Flavivirga algicola]